jgi:hypothetical protein
MGTTLTTIAERLLAGCYYNPRMVQPMVEEEPVMPTPATELFWSELTDIQTPRASTPLGSLCDSV